jgi:hypothetical protein
LYETIAISLITMKRLMNYQRVTENKARAANNRQWRKMTLETMHKAEETRQTAAHIGATVAYAGYLFRVQNKMSACLPSHCDGPLFNALVELMNTLDIPVEMIAVEGDAFRPT